MQIDADGRFVESALDSRDIPPSPAVARAAARIAALIKHWDDATYDAVLAPALPKPQMQALFDKLRVLHKACTVGAPLEGDGGPSAVVTLDLRSGRAPPAVSHGRRARRTSEPPDDQSAVSLQIDGKVPER